MTKIYLSEKKNNLCGIKRKEKRGEGAKAWDCDNCVELLQLEEFLLMMVYAMADVFFSYYLINHLKMTN